MNRRPPVKTRPAKQKVSGGLKGFASTRKPAVDLLRDVQAHVVAQGNKNLGAGREKHKIHVSDLIKSGACPRQMYYKVTQTPATDTETGSVHQMEVIWAAGHDAHRKWQRWLQEMGDLFGSWRCNACFDEWEGETPEACPGCGRKDLLEYRELELEDVVLSLVGHADGAVPRLNTLVEIKSFSVGSVRYEQPLLVKAHTHRVNGKSIVDAEGVWKDIKRPFKSHIKQGSFYLWMCQRLGLPYDRIIFIYENKATQSTKSFEIKLSEKVIQEYIDTLEAVQVAMAEGVAPKRPALFTKDASPCKTCPFRSTCYNEESSDNSTESPPVSLGGSSERSEEAGGEAEVQPARPTRGRGTPSPGRRYRDGRPATDHADDGDDTVAGAPGGAVVDGGGGRAVGGSSEGQGTRSRFSRDRQGRNRTEVEGLRE